jgi:PAS domain S-box-containing protein
VEALRQSEDRFRAIAETTPVGIGVVGLPEAVFLYVNPAYEKAFGYAKDEILGKGTPDIYWDQTERDAILCMLKERGNVAEYEVRLKHKDGTMFWGLASVRPITFNGKAALLGSFTDITERKKAEEAVNRQAEELRRGNEELERFNRISVGRELRMVELKKEVNELLDLAGKPLRYKTEFEKE